MVTLWIYLILVVDFYLISAVYSCAYNEFAIEDGQQPCVKCPSCSAGTGLSPQCGDVIKQSNPIKCQLCKLGLTYSDKDDSSSCKPCQICAKHQTVTKNCTLTSNSQCNNTCSYGYYYEELTGDCQKCQEGQYLVADNKGGHCEKCKVCPPGTSLYPHCGSVVESTSDITCVKCVRGETFSDKGSPCRGCSKCSLGQEELAPCSLTSDTVCSKCVKGFYKDENSTGCKPCSACCNDGEDVHVAECAEQNMPQSQQCSYTRRAVRVCQQQRNQGPTPQNSKRSAVVSIAVGVAVGLSVFVVAMLYWGLKYRKDKRRSNPESLALLVRSEDEEVTQATLEDPLANGKQETLSFEKSGVVLQFSDADSFIQDAQGIRLEICWDKAATVTLLPHEVQLSPVIKFHPHGYKMSKPVHVRIPHTALVFQSHGWNIKLKSSSLQSGAFVWQDDEISEVHNNEVSFHANSLLCYVVVGTAVYNSKPTKKRLQCAVFGGEGKVGENFTVYLYVFDDCEASLEKIMQEERSKNRILLGSIQSLYVESVLDTDIKITIQQPLKGWKVGYIQPQVISHKSLQESFQRIPRSEILFEHDHGRNRDFLCTFELAADNITTNICAVASIKEDPFKRYQESDPTTGHNHQMVTGRNLCDPLITNKDKPSLCFHKLPKEIRHAVCMKLDLSLKGVGDWRHVAEKLGFTQQDIELFRAELLTPDGSPCTVMLEALRAKLPEITVAEFVQILQFWKIRRFDVVDILEPYVYDTIPDVETANSCTENQFLVEHEDGSTSCEDCETCPPGQGLWPKCGTRVPANTMIKCVPCQPGVSFSSNYDTSSCSPCAPPCLKDQVVLKKCTPTENVRCAKQCYSKDSYYDSIGERCQACSQCCGQERDVTVDECKQKLGASSDMICSLSSAKWCVTTTATTLVTTSETSGLLNIFTRGSHLRSKRKDSVGAPILAAGIFGLVLVITCGLTSLLCSREPCSFPSGDVENGHHLEQKPLSTDEMLGSAGGGERNEAECETDNSVVVRSGSRELLLNKQVQHSEAFTCTCQMDSKKDSKLLSSLLDDENALEMICTCLDTPIPLLGDYRAVAQHYGFNHYQITSRLEKEAGGPSKALIESIVAIDPDLTVQEFAAVVGETTNRNDVVKLLRTFDLVGDKEICKDLSQE